MIARVYHAINAVAAALARDGVAKTRLNARDNYLYRSIDDVLERLAPLLAAERLCILPRVLERDAAERQDESGVLMAVTLRVAFDLVSAEDGSSHTIEAYGEALDAGDKATAKAMQSAYKYAVLQAFCVPAASADDADASSHRLAVAPGSATSPTALPDGVIGRVVLTADPLPPEPPQGWQGWCQELVTAARGCSDRDALERRKAGARPLLAALQRGSPALYDQVGEALALRTRELAAEDRASAPGRDAMMAYASQDPCASRTQPAHSSSLEEAASASAPSPGVNDSATAPIAQASLLVDVANEHHSTFEKAGSDSMAPPGSTPRKSRSAIRLPPATRARKSHGSAT